MPDIATESRDALEYHRGPSVLILDDSRIDRSRTCRMMRGILPGCRSAEASDLGQFRQQLDVQSFDLVFLDYNLGHQTGLEALALLTSHPRQQGAAAIMLTGSISGDLADEAYRAGCMEFLLKDAIDDDSLARAIKHARDRKRVAIELGD